jgi:predicted dehydrogenase
MNRKKIWLAGCGPMAVEYAKVLQAQQILFEVIGRSEASAKSFEAQTGIVAVYGGLENFLNQKAETPDYAIIAVSAEQLSAATELLLNYGVKNILVEKPAALTVQDIKRIDFLAHEKNADVTVAYNRRFYASVIKAQEIIAEDGGLTSFHFEFTEWAHVIEPLPKALDVKKHWFIGNSTHVIDTAFFLGGVPVEMTAYTKGGELFWHKPSIFTGAGRTNRDALFSYCANWQAPGRWGIELMTKKHRLYLKPMETIQIQIIGSIDVKPVEIDDSLDKQFKPGLYLETKAFLNNEHGRLCTLSEQCEHFNLYYQMLNQL